LRRAPKPQRRSRQSAKARTLERKRQLRKRFRTALIVCEGAKTEPKYFNALRAKLSIPYVSVDIYGSQCGSDPVSVVQYAKNRKEEYDYDEIWCVFDTERFSQKGPRKFSQALNMAAANGVLLAISNPCFEYWFLLHFVRCGNSLSTGKRACDKLKKYLPSYEKGNSLFAQLYPLTDTAIANAKDVLRTQWHSEPDYMKRDPSTEVFKVVELLRDIAANPKTD